MVKSGNNIRKRFRQWRARMGLSLREVAEAVNDHLPPEEQVAKSTVNNYEGRNDPSVVFLEALKRAYPEDVDVGWLVFGADRPGESEPHDDSLIARLEGGDAREADRIFGRARPLVEAFLQDIQEVPASSKGRSSLEGLEELRPVYEALKEILSIPPKYADHFVSLDEMTAGEVKAYIGGLLSQLRSIHRTTRADERSAHWASFDR